MHLSSVCVNQKPVKLGYMALINVKDLTKLY